MNIISILIFLLKLQRKRKSMSNLLAIILYESHFDYKMFDKIKNIVVHIDSFLKNKYNYSAEK